MRRACALLALAVAPAGCSGADDRVWDGPPAPLPAGGALPVEAFAAFQDSVDEAWERRPALVAAEFLRLDRATAARATVEEETGGEGGGPASVVVTLDGLLDDSVRAQRFELTLARDGETWRLESASWTQRCQPGRGHRAFSPAPCL